MLGFPEMVLVAVATVALIVALLEIAIDVKNRIDAREKDD